MPKASLALGAFATVVGGAIAGGLGSFLGPWAGVALLVGGALLIIAVVLASKSGREAAREHLARVEAEAAWHRLEALLFSAPIGILFIDRRGRVALSNPAVRALVRDAEVEDDRALRQIVRAPDGSELAAETLPHHRALAGADMRGVELAIRRDGRPDLPILVNATPVRVPGGEIVGAVVAVQEISARKELERFRDEYLALISHDLRSPLNNIRLEAQLLRRMLSRTSNERGAQLAADIDSDVGRMDRMIQELLELSRLEQKRLNLRPESTELGSWVRSVVERTLGPELVQRVRVSVEDPGACAAVDRARLERVLVNLVVNAAKYSERDTDIRVRVYSEGGKVCVSVADSGPGLAPEDAARIFEKYYRVKSTDRVPGFGLGLYISRLIVEAHQGRIWVESVPGAGSVFAFAVPILEQTLPSSAVA